MTKDTVSRCSDIKITKLPNGRVSVERKWARPRQVDREEWCESWQALIEAGECKATPGALARYCDVSWHVANVRLQSLVKRGLAVRAPKETFNCPNGCGELFQHKCKLRCKACGYFDSCADFY